MSDEHLVLTLHIGVLKENSKCAFEFHARLPLLFVLIVFGEGGGFRYLTRNGRDNRFHIGEDTVIHDTELGIELLWVNLLPLPVFLIPILKFLQLILHLRRIVLPLHGESE